MNVFVLCTGRCGSLTFQKACQHMTNFTSGHETLARKVGKERFKYPSNHIEIDNRLSWMLGRLDQKFGDHAKYVHLRREPRDVIASYRKRKYGIMKAYRSGVLQGAKEAKGIDTARDMVITLEKNIALFLKSGNKSQMKVILENAQNDFAEFWRWIGAEGDLNKALKEFEIKHNATLER